RASESPESQQSPWPYQYGWKGVNGRTDATPSTRTRAGTLAMTASLLLSIALITQAANSAGNTNAPATANAPAVPKGPAKTEYKATLQATIDRKKAAQAKKSKGRVAKRLQEQAESKARRDQAERMAPGLAAQQRDDLRFQMEAQALQQMSSAMMQNAA